MDILISKEELVNLVVNQLKNMLFFDEENELQTLIKNIEIALKKSKLNFSHNKNKYYSNKGNVIFNPFHSGQYSVFLYYLSNTTWKQGNLNFLADRIYYLNKILNSVDLFYEIELPEIFNLDHPVGTVLGRASYSDYFMFSQNVTVGNNKGKYPIFEKKVILFSGVTIIGNSHIQENSLISANTYIKDTDIPRNSIVFGSSPNLTIIEKDDSYFADVLKSKFVL